MRRVSSDCTRETISPKSEQSSVCRVLFGSVSISDDGFPSEPRTLIRALCGFLGAFGNRKSPSNKILKTFASHKAFYEFWFWHSLWPTRGRPVGRRDAGMGLRGRRGTL